MKHTDFYTLVSELRQLEIKELTDAVNAHDGCYEWDEDEEKAVLTVISDSSEYSAKEVEITKVFIEDGHLCIDGYDLENEEPVDFKLSEVIVGELSSIIDYIPEINGIDDVTTRKENNDCFYILVQHPRDASYFKENEIGYPSFESEDSGVC